MARGEEGEKKPPALAPLAARVAALSLVASRAARRAHRHAAHVAVEGHVEQRPLLAPLFGT
jgi:hypothetical protein